MVDPLTDYREVIEFWFGEAPLKPNPPGDRMKLWYGADPAHLPAIRARFGRFPHRNRALGRQSTPEEVAYLAGGPPAYGQDAAD